MLKDVNPWGLTSLLMLVVVVAAAATTATPPVVLKKLSFSFQFWLKRPLSMWQFAGAFLIVTSIVTAKLPDIVGKGTSGGINAVPLAAISLAIVASSNSGNGFGEQRIPSLSYCMLYVRSSGSEMRQ